MKTLHHPEDFFPIARLSILTAAAGEWPDFSPNFVPCRHGAKTRGAKQDMEDRIFTETILRWYAENGRDLPRRRTRDPYAVWLSEIILQQTRIVQGQAYWERFMQRFPNVESLAAASEDEILRLWQGLGYYSRARNLLAAARQIDAIGHFPDTVEDLRSLKGVGEYTAAAVGSIAFGLPVAVVDGNVYRVLSRYFGIFTPVNTPAAKKEFSRLAQALLPEDCPADFNQGIMDFGALQCTPASPDCYACPLLAGCNARKTGRVGMLPVKKQANPVRERFFCYVYLRFQGQTALRRRPAGDIWQGRWEPLLYELGPEEDSKAFLSAKGLPGTLTLLRKGIRHQLTHQTLFADLFLWEPACAPELPEGYVLIPEMELDRYAKPRLVEILTEAIPDEA